MKYIIRKPDIETLTDSGIPGDFADVMRYFNDAFDFGAYPYIPRLEKITEDEIRNIWVPGADKDITYHAFFPDIPDPQNPEKTIKQTGIPAAGVYGSGTLFVDKEKNEGEYSVSLCPRVYFNGVAKAITLAVFNEAKEKDISVRIHVSAHNYLVVEGLKKLGFRRACIIPRHEPYVGRIRPPENAAEENRYSAFMYFIRPDEM